MCCSAQACQNSLCCLPGPDLSTDECVTQQQPWGIPDVWIDFMWPFNPPPAARWTSCPDDIDFESLEAAHIIPGLEVAFSPTSHHGIIHRQYVLDALTISISWDRGYQTILPAHGKYPGALEYATLAVAGADFALKYIQLVLCFETSHSLIPYPTLYGTGQ